MTRTMGRKRWAMLAVAAALAVSAGAQAQGYIGGNVGSSRIDVDCAGLTSCDKSDTGYKLYGGYDFGGGLAAELAYFNWGKAKGTGTLNGTAGSGTLKADGFGAGVAYFFPLGSDWVPALRAGVVRNTGKIDLTASVGGASSSEKFNTTTGYLGLGIGYKVGPDLFVTGEWDFSRVKYGDIDKADVQVVSVGLRYKF